MLSVSTGLPIDINKSSYQKIIESKSIVESTPSWRSPKPRGPSIDKSRRKLSLDVPCPNVRTGSVETIEHRKAKLAESTSRLYQSKVVHQLISACNHDLSTLRQKSVHRIVQQIEEKELQSYTTKPIRHQPINSPARALRERFHKQDEFKNLTHAHTGQSPGKEGSQNYTSTPSDSGSSSIVVPSLYSPIKDLPKHLTLVDATGSAPPKSLGYGGRNLVQSRITLEKSMVVSRSQSEAASIPTASDRTWSKSSEKRAKPAAGFFARIQSPVPTVLPPESSLISAERYTDLPAHSPSSDAQKIDREKSKDPSRESVLSDRFSSLRPDHSSSCATPDETSVSERSNTSKQPQHPVKSATSVSNSHSDQGPLFIEDEKQQYNSSFPANQGIMELSPKQLPQDTSSSALGTSALRPKQNNPMPTKISLDEVQAAPDFPSLGANHGLPVADSTPLPTTDPLPQNKTTTADLPLNSLPNALNAKPGKRRRLLNKARSHLPKKKLLTLLLGREVARATETATTTSQSITQAIPISNLDGAMMLAGPPLGSTTLGAPRAREHRSRGYRSNAGGSEFSIPFSFIFSRTSLPLSEPPQPRVCEHHNYCRSCGRRRRGRKSNSFWARLKRALIGVPEGPPLCDYHRRQKRKSFLHRFF